MMGRVTTALAVVTLAAASSAAATCQDDVADLRGDWGLARFGVEIADTDEERSTGLMERDLLPRSRGMLFIYDPPEPAFFWMRRTSIPLDIIFFDSRGLAFKVHRDAVPFSRELIASESPAMAILEINAGLSDAFGIDVGTQLRHRRLDPDIAAWPCEAG